MSVIMRAALVLQPGCKLYYDPPDMSSENLDADRFFKAHGGKFGTFEGYSETLVGVLDHKGRVPGSYINLAGVRIRFDGEAEAHNLNIRHIVVVDSERAAVTSVLPTERQRVGELPHPILFYPRDTVRLKQKPQYEPDSFDLSIPRQVAEVFLDDKRFAVGGVPRYYVVETKAEYEARKKENESKPRFMFGTTMQWRGWNTPHEEIELISRGNVWALYNDPSKLAFADDAEESAFWAIGGISKSVVSKNENRDATMQLAFGDSLRDAYELFASGAADVLVSTGLKSRTGDPTEPARYHAKILHGCFAEHRERVRALTKRLWEPQLQQVVA